MTILMTPSNKHLISCFILYREKDIKQTKKIDGLTNECKMWLIVSFPNLTNVTHNTHLDYDYVEGVTGGGWAAQNSELVDTLRAGQTLGTYMALNRTDEDQRYLSTKVQVDIVVTRAGNEGMGKVNFWHLHLYNFEGTVILDE